MKRNSPNKPQSTGGNSGVSETSTNFSFGSGRAYGDNVEYSTKNLTFDILEITREPGRGFDGTDRWSLTVKAADRDSEILTLGCNPKRDEELGAAQAHLARGGTIVNKRLHRSGTAFYLRDGDR
jgi:hypothetical protein